jgi:hypothetical protein
MKRAIVLLPRRPVLQGKTWFFLAARRERGAAHRCAGVALEQIGSCSGVVRSAMEN